MGCLRTHLQKGHIKGALCFRNLNSSVRSGIILNMSGNSAVYRIRATIPSDRVLVRRLTRENWGADFVVAHDEIFHPADLPGFVAESKGQTLGLATYRISEDSCEMLTLDSFQPGQGIGSALLEAVRDAGRRAGCRRFWLITSNDNLNALRFYQKRGLRLCAVRRDALNRARRLKPTIPLIGEDDIPLCDELELEMFYPQD